MFFFYYTIDDDWNTFKHYAPFAVHKVEEYEFVPVGNQVEKSLIHAHKTH